MKTEKKWRVAKTSKRVPKVFLKTSLKNPFPFIISFLILKIYCAFQAVIQYYEIEADNEYVIRGNAVVMKCKIPSYISDFISVESWLDTDNNTYNQNASEGVNLFTNLPSFVPDI